MDAEITFGIIPREDSTQSCMYYLLHENAINDQDDENVKGNYSYQSHNSEATNATCNCLGDSGREKNLTFMKSVHWEEKDETAAAGCAALRLVGGRACQRALLVLLQAAHSHSLVWMTAIVGWTWKHIEHSTLHLKPFQMQKEIEIIFSTKLKNNIF